MLIRFFVFYFIIFNTFLFAKEWQNNYVESNQIKLIKATLFKNGLGQINIGIVAPTDECSGFSNTIMQAPSFKINGTNVRMYAQCISKNERMDFPETEAGRTYIIYIINEFKTKSQVSYEQSGITISFNAKGFTKAFNNYDDIDEGI